MNTLTVVLIGYVVYASDDCVAESRGPVNCYECSTERHEYYCQDPFNTTVAGLKVVKCEEACAKWVRKPKFGPTHIIRTCASMLNVNMHWSHVCMEESRPGDGKLCFCNDNFCNTGSTLRSKNATYPLALVCLSLSTLLFIHVYSSGYLDFAEWCTNSLTSSLFVLMKTATLSFGLYNLLLQHMWTWGCRLRKNDTKDSNTG